MNPYDSQNQSEEVIPKSQGLNQEVLRVAWAVCTFSLSIQVTISKFLEISLHPRWLYIGLIWGPLAAITAAWLTGYPVSLRILLSVLTILLLFAQLIILFIVGVLLGELSQ